MLTMVNPIDLEVTVQRWRSRWVSLTNVGCAGMLRFALVYLVNFHAEEIFANNAISEKHKNYPIPISTFTVLDFLWRSMEIKINTVGEMHPDIGVSLTNLGVLEEIKGDYAASLAIYNSALNIFRVSCSNVVIGQSEGFSDRISCIHELCFGCLTLFGFILSNLVNKTSVRYTYRMLSCFHTFYCLD